MYLKWIQNVSKGVVSVFTYLELSNVKSLNHIQVDLSKSNRPKSVVSIYGENGSGKSSIMLAFQILAMSVRTVEFSQQFVQLTSSLDEKSGSFIPVSNLLALSKKFSNMTEMMKGVQTFGTNENSKFIFGFLHEGKPGTYEFEFNQGNLVRETLSYRLKTRTIIFYDIQNTDARNEMRLHSSVFSDRKLLIDLKQDIEKLWGKHTLLSIIHSYLARFNTEFVKHALANELLEIISQFENISVRNQDFGSLHQSQILLQNLAMGQVDFKDKEKVEKNASALFTFFSALYTDIEDVYYQFEEQNGVLNYHLYFSKRIGETLSEIPFELESHGTQNLLNLYPIFVSLYLGETVIIDEIDSGIHDLLIQKLLENLTDEIKGQLIFTTHDTFLLRELPKESAYFINIKDDGTREVYSVDQFSGVRVMANNNLQKMYLDGNFGGIPYPMDLDMERVIEELGGAK
jgi:AAA15 family ATPase/GTPase